MENHKRKNNTARGKGRRGTGATAPQTNVSLSLERSIGHSKVFPAKLMKTFTTSGVATLTGDGIGVTPQIYSISINSLFDPDYTATGHSPLYYDSLLGTTAGYAPYNMYNVVSARLKAQFVNTGAANVALGDVAIFLRVASASTLDDANELAEAEYAINRPLGSGYSDNGIVTLVYDVKRSLMAKMQNYGNIEDCPNNVATYNADPSLEVLCDMMYLPYISSSTNVVYVKWTLEQDALLYRVNDIAASAPRPPRVPKGTPEKVARALKLDRAAPTPLAHPTGCFCGKCRPEQGGKV